MLQWLQKVLFLQDEEIIQYIEQEFSKRNVDGKQLEKMTEEDIKKICPKDADTVLSTLLDALNLLKKEGIFDERKFRILRKMNTSPKFKGYDSDTKMKIASFLCSEKALKQGYLSTNVENVKKLLNSLPKRESVGSLKDTLRMYDINVQKLTNFRDVEKTLKVKLVITNINTPDSMKKILSPIVNKIPKYTSDYGLFHTALIVG